MKPSEGAPGGDWGQTMRKEGSQCLVAWGQANVMLQKESSDQQSTAVDRGSEVGLQYWRAISTPNEGKTPLRNTEHFEYAHIIIFTFSSLKVNIEKSGVATLHKVRSGWLGHLSIPGQSCSGPGLWTLLCLWGLYPSGTSMFHQHSWGGFTLDFSIPIWWHWKYKKSTIYIMYGNEHS